MKYDVDLNLYRANGLPIADVFSSDPYMKVAIDLTDVVIRTRPLFATLNPVWDEEVHIKNVSLKDIFKIEVWDFDKLNKDDLLGFCEYVYDGKDGDVVIELKRGGKRTGTVTLKVKSTEAPQGEGADAKAQIVTWAGPKRYNTHKSGVAGLLAMLKTDEDQLAYATHEVMLPNVRAVFDNVMQPWNKEYPNAQKIFTSVVVKQIVQKQHHGLYKHAKTSRYGPVLTGLDFLRIFNFAKRGSKSHMYTYVLLEDRIRFSETGAAFFTDFMSKHAMHANAAEEVFYAGEFHVEEGAEGKWKFVIDNNSGTYAPDKSKLPHLQKLLADHFTDIEVEALDRDDAKLKAWREKHIK